MYEAHFGLTRPPFPPASDPHYYFPAESIETARQNLLRCLERGEGTALVIGRSGTGKTLLCQVLGEQLRPRLAVVHLCSGRLGSRSALYQAILHGLGRPYRGMDEGELRLALVDYLAACENGQEGLALLVDEAHTMPLRLLDEIRMLTNLVCSGQPRVRVLLAGDPVLEERFASPKLESFSQRLAVRCYIEPFRSSETQQYIRAQIEAAGGDARRRFPAEAATAVHQATEGVPRLVNQLCDHAMVLAYADGDATVDAGRVEAAWADLQQLPAPWTGEAAAKDSSEVIEFGGLEDDSLPGDEAASTATASEGLPWPSTGKQSDDEPEPFEPAPCGFPDVAVAAGDEGRFRPVGVIGPEIDLTTEEPRGPFAEPFVEEEEIVQPFRAKAAPSRVEGVAASSPVATMTEAESPVRAPRLASSRDDVADYETQKTLIVIEEEGELPELDAAPRAVVGRPSQYSRLFAKLRRG